MMKTYIPLLLLATEAKLLETVVHGEIKLKMTW
jgi:hypothetical protein